MMLPKLAAPALAWIAFWSPAPADARVFVLAPVLGAPSNAAPTLIDDRDDRAEEPRADDDRNVGDDEESDDLDMMDMGDDEDEDDGSNDRSDDGDDDDQRERGGDRRN